MITIFQTISCRCCDLISPTATDAQRTTAGVGTIDIFSIYEKRQLTKHNCIQCGTQNTMLLRLATTTITHSTQRVRNGEHFVSRRPRARKRLKMAAALSARACVNHVAWSGEGAFSACRIGVMGECQLGRDVGAEGRASQTPPPSW